jgi:hypothetical protein
VTAAILAADSPRPSGVSRTAEAGRCGIRFPVIVKEKKQEFPKLDTVSTMDLNCNIEITRGSEEGVGINTNSRQQRILSRNTRLSRHT